MTEPRIDRRGFFEKAGAGALGALAGGALAGGRPLAARDGSSPASLSPAPAREEATPPVPGRKVRLGIVGFGVCQFGAKFGFQDHPSVEVVAVSDLFPDRRAALMKACRCSKSYESLEKLVEDRRIEAVFVATDAPSHARHAMEVLRHEKHVMTAVPAVWGSIEEAEELLETARKSGLVYMMAETSCYRADCHAMRQVHRAGGFGRLVYSEGEYYHYHEKPIDSYRGWRIGCPPLWYPTHSTAYYVGVSGGRFTSVSCLGFRGSQAAYRPGANRYENRFTDEVALLETSEGGTSRMSMCKAILGRALETGRVYGERGWMEGTTYHGSLRELPELSRPALPPGVPAGGHGGSHGPLACEFVSAILEKRRPLVDVHAALAMTVPGIIAHRSALKDGERLPIPEVGRSFG